MCLFAGLIVMMDLRLLGIGNMQTPFSQLQKRLFPWQMVGMACSAVTGLALVYRRSDAVLRQHLLLAEDADDGLAGINAMAFHYITYYSASTLGLGQGAAVRRQAGRRARRGAVGAS